MLFIENKQFRLDKHVILKTKQLSQHPLCASMSVGTNFLNIRDAHTRPFVLEPHCNRRSKAPWDETGSPLMVKSKIFVPKRGTKGSVLARYRFWYGVRPFFQVINITSA